MRSEPRIRLLFLVALPALVTALGLGACRELTTPSGDEQDIVLARGRVVDARENPQSQVEVEIVRDGEDGDAFERFYLRLETDLHGYFEAWVPRSPLDLTFTPPRSSPLPRTHSYGHEFEEGRLDRFHLPGQRVVGRIAFTETTFEFLDPQLSLNTRITHPNGSERHLGFVARVGVGGLFETFVVPSEDFAVELSDWNSGNTLSYTWDDSVRIASEDSLLLELPLSSYVLELQLGGAALPPAATSFVSVTTYRDGEIRRSYTRYGLTTDGVRESFEIPMFEGAREISIDPGSSSRFFVPIRLNVAPLTEGASIRQELGLHRLEFQVRDEQGLGLHLAEISVSSERSEGSAVHLKTDLEGRCELRANPIGHRIQVGADAFVPQEKFFQVLGDSTITLDLQRDSY